MSVGKQSWISDAGLAALAVVTVIFAVYVLGRQPEPTGSPDAVDRAADATPSPSSPSSPPSPTSSASVDGDEEQSLLVLGDESVQGARTAGRWLTELPDLDVANSSRPFSGYLQDAPADRCTLPSCPSLPRMLATIDADESPDVVLVSAGSHDVTAERVVLGQGISSFFSSLRERFPDALIVVFSPVVRDGETPAGLDAVTQVVQAQAERVDAAFVDVGQPFLEASRASAPDRLTEAGEVLRSAFDEAVASS